MKWSDLGKTIAGTGAKLLGGAIGGPAGAAVGSLVASALGVDDDPETVQKAIAADPQAAIKLRELEERNRTDLEKLHIRAAETSVQEVNATMRVEAQSEDGYTRRARPTLIYQLGLIITILVVGSLVLFGMVAVNDPKSLPEVVKGVVGLVDALMVPLGLLAAAVGVYVRSRSTHDKALKAGKEPPAGLLQGLAARLMK